MNNSKIQPSWRGALPYLLAGIENGTPKGQKIAREELCNMADAADLMQFLFDTLRLAQEALEHSTANMAHYPEAAERHRVALAAVQDALSKT